MQPNQPLAAMTNLSAICEAIREDLEERNAARDRAIVLSRDLIRHASQSIRAIHRRDWDSADAKLTEVQSGAAELKAMVADFPDALTHGLRRQTDIVRSVLERTRGDLTQSLRQQRLQDVLK